MSQDMEEQQHGKSMKKEKIGVLKLYISHRKKKEEEED
jgi:hypothetical protein